MSPAPVRFIFGLHFHQPVGNFDYVFADHVRDVYRPILERAQAANFFPLVVHFSGPLLEWLEQHDPEYLDYVGSLASDGKLELLLAGFDEPILLSLPRLDRLEQIERMREFLKQRFGVVAGGLWLTERVWAPELASDLSQAGVEYALVDDRHFLVSGFAKDELHRPFRTESNGRMLGLLAIDERLRYLIPFRPPEETADYLRELRANGHALAVLADDGEKFGGWPGTREWVYEKNWLGKFFDAVGQVLESGDAVLSTGADAMKLVPSAGLAYLPTASYREMETWALPAAAQGRMHRLDQHLGPEKMASASGSLVRGGHWRHFLVKYAEANRLQKMMQALSNLCRDKGDPPGARRAIGRAQCNDAYWHGVFGGLYLPHLRRALWSQLAIAERELRSGQELAAEVVDYDFDGHDEMWVHSANFSAIVSPWRGGTVEVFTRFGDAINLADALTRRREFYHEPVPGEASTEMPPADLDVRALFVDRVLPGDVSESDFINAAYAPLLSWAFRPMEPVIKTDNGTVEIVLAGDGLTKRMVFGPAGDLRVSWKWDPAAFAPDSVFTTEISLAQEVPLQLTPDAEAWRFPITTVAKSERGFDETVQGTSITPRWPASLGQCECVIP